MPTSGLLHRHSFRRALFLITIVIGLVIGIRVLRNRSQPTFVTPVVSGTPIATQRPPQLAITYHAGLLLAPDGRLWAWGNYLWSTLGRVPPNPTPTLLDPTHRWTRIAGASHHFLMIRDDGTLWGLGANFYGQLGNPPGADSNLVQLSTSTQWVDIAAGNHSNLGLQRDGTLWAWGGNHLGSLGLGDPTQDAVYPIRPVNPDDRWRAIGMNLRSSWAIHTNGSLWSWGMPLAGAIYTRPERITTQAPWDSLGTGGMGVLLRRNDTLFHHSSSPDDPASFPRLPIDIRPIPGTEGISWTDEMFTAGDGVFARQSDGSWWGMGDNRLGRFGLGTYQRVTSMTRLPWPKETLALAATQNATYAFLADGTLWYAGVQIDGPPPPNNSSLAARFAQTLNTIAAVLINEDLSKSYTPHSRFPVPLWTWPTTNHGQPTTHNPQPTTND